MRIILSRLIAALSFLGVFGTLLASPVFANNGPVGQNELRTEGGPGIGEITLNWKRVSLNLTSYSLVYGTTSGNYKFGAYDIGNIVTFTVKGLVPGQNYCFKVYPHLDGQISTPLSPEICDIASTSARTVIGTSGPIGRNSLTAIAGPKIGQVTLNWKKYFSDTNFYALVYGTKPGVYKYGVLDARDVTSPGDNDFSFVVGALNPGTRYYFALIPVRSGIAQYITAEVSQVSP